MADYEHQFRYLLKPGSNFQFVAKFRFWLVLSFLLMSVSIGSLFVNKAVRGEYMNWTIDFRGGTEIIYAFHDPADPAKYAKVDPGKVRTALEQAGADGFDVSDLTWTVEGADGQEITVPGMTVRTPQYSAISPEQSRQVVDAFSKLADKQVEKVAWSGDRLFVRSRQPMTEADVKAIFDAAKLDLKPWTPEEAKLHATPDEGTGEYSSVFGVWGVDRQYAAAIERTLGGPKVDVVQSYGVGAKAGDKLRNDAAKSLFYAIFLIMLYLAFRFDIRYAPGAAFATIHDAIMVVGVFSITWTDVSLTSVAALLTVVGYSVNDTVVIFDRIRENQTKMHDKKIERIVDISLNETLVRSILTSLTVFATTLVMNIFGDGLVRNFAFAMNIGVIVGSYSSLFLAPPIFLWISKRFYSGTAPARRARAEAVAAEP